MGVSISFFFLLLLGIIWARIDARSILISDVSATQISYQASRDVGWITEADLRNEKVCSLCEQFTAQAVSYLSENKTQTEVIESLHQACSRLHTFQRECVTLVDYYAPLFFVEMALVKPEDFCRKVNLCEEEALRSVKQYEDICELCHRALVEVLLKLRDPDTQLDIIQALLKECNRVENYVKQCKKLVFEYGPVILANAEHFLEANDLCTVVHVCKPTQTEEPPLAEMQMKNESLYAAVVESEV